MEFIHTILKNNNMNIIIIYLCLCLFIAYNMALDDKESNKIISFIIYFFLCPFFISRIIWNYLKNNINK